MSHPPQPAWTEPPSRAALFAAFFKIGMLGFGGVAAWARHVLVVERGFIDARDFAESFGLASTLPGANTVNLATMLGDRFRGWTGSAAALAGLLGAPLVCLALIATLYARFGDIPDVKAGLFGAAATAAGVVVGSSLKILHDLDPDLAAILVVAAVGVATLLKVPMVLILVVAIPASFAVRILAKRRAS